MSDYEISYCPNCNEPYASHLIANAHVICRGAAILCGQPWFDACMRRLDPDMHIGWRASEGSRVDAGSKVCELRGKARAIVTAERMALNFLQTLSAVATLTRRYVDAVSGTRAAIVDTRNGRSPG